jgi:cytochrome b561
MPLHGVGDELLGRLGALALDDLPPWIGPDRALAHNLREIHETLGVTGYYLICLHVVAALFHHYIMRDGTLARMLPFLNPGAKDAI